jgi:hypothetical protein
MDILHRDLHAGEPAISGATYQISVAGKKCFVQNMQKKKMKQLVPNLLVAEILYSSDY